MNLWDGLVVDRSNLPCVGRPLDLYPEYAAVEVPPESMARKPRVHRVAQGRPTIRKVGDIVGDWKILAFAKGSSTESDVANWARKRWHIQCQCGCKEERWVRTDRLTKWLVCNSNR